MAELDRQTKSKDYHDYVIKDGKFIGAFEEMYQNVDDPWHHGDASDIQYDLALHLTNKHGICKGGGLVLDIGCGKGAFSARLKHQMPKAHILAVDISPTAIRKAEQKCGRFGIKFQVMDIQKEYKNITERFDLIVRSLARRALKSDGHLLINQCFYKPEEQRYGKETVATIEDMLNLVNLEVVGMIELNRLINHDAIVLFKNSRSKSTDK